MLGLNAERKLRAQLVRLAHEDQDGDEDEDDQGDLQDLVDGGGDSVDIPKFGAMEIEARVEIFAFMRAQGYKPADNRASSGRFVRSPGGRVVQPRVDRHGARFLPEAAPISRA